MKVVLRIGGSVLGDPPAAKIVNAYAEVISDLNFEGHSVAVVVGGGGVAREYIKSAAAMGLSPYQQDTVAIHASRLNARLVAMKLGGVSSVPTSIDGMLQRLARNRVAVMGGLKPGITTDTVAAIVAERWRADLMVKASDQSGIYTEDPRVNKKARKLDRITYEKMKEILGGSHRPGIHSIVDPVAVDRLTGSRIKLVVLNGADAKGVVRAAHGERIGTVVS
ncbi:MAG: UMP kinase [Nitrososphaerota archaeon]|nr:UMP kinase [Nitrososphaerota archaeon]MDG6911584.1 UMP kinase [Nitrososphaerota archaeon]MDG6940488.1 UMP kinase [Nitrososphaerota archaeon]MDG6960799.1 UMP kinase [Nitrososphaerota archaeon]MDG6962315.1 UMP kinase [Nitrososphaerota archaeon]